MLGSIYIGLSGMNAYSKGLQTISNNVANMNSPGYKATSVNFTDLFSVGGLGSSFTGKASQQRGNGVGLGALNVDFGQGDLRPSGGDLDLAIQGGGFLVMLDGDKTLYARTGQFAVDGQGYISQQGTGYRLAVLGDDGRATALSVDGKRTSRPVATTSITFADNLSTTATEAVVSDIAVHDSLGTNQGWQVRFQPVGAASPNQWTVTVRDKTGATIGTSTLRFVGGVVDPATARLTINQTVAGAAPLSVVLDFSKGVTSLSAGTASTLRAASVDGRGTGALTGVKINAQGRVELAYSNTQKEVLGAVALADFRDPQQLERVGNGLFQSQMAPTRLLASRTDGMGSVVTGQFEASNVDLSQQFGDLILVQRGFQASSQVVSVSNDMIQQLFGIRGQG